MRWLIPDYCCDTDIYNILVLLRNSNVRIPVPKILTETQLIILSSVSIFSSVLSYWTEKTRKLYGFLKVSSTSLGGFLGCFLALYGTDMERTKIKDIDPAPDPTMCSKQADKTSPFNGLINTNEGFTFLSERENPDSEPAPHH